MSVLSRRRMLAGGSALLLAPSETLGRPTSLPELCAPAETLVCVFLRGGADALSLVVPYTDPEYYRARPRIAVAPPGAAELAALDLDGRTGLHPAFAPLLPAFFEGELLIALGVGLSDPSHGHSEARRRLRALPPLAGHDDSAPELDELASLPDQLSAIAARIEASDGRAIHWVEQAGWDTHVAQPARVAGLARELAAGLLAFHRRISRRKSTTAVAVFSEFGRTLHENVTSGTGDGHGGALFVLGAPVRGGRIIGDHGVARTDPVCDALPAPIELHTVLKMLAPAPAETRTA